MRANGIGFFGAVVAMGLVLEYLVARKRRPSWTAAAAGSNRQLSGGEERYGFQQLFGPDRRG